MNVVSDSCSCARIALLIWDGETDEAGKLVAENSLVVCLTSLHIL